MVYTDQLQTKKREYCRCAQMSGVDVCWTPGVQRLGCCYWDCLGSVSAYIVPKAACALQLDLGSCIQQLDKYLVNLLTYLPNLIECNTPLTILNKQTKNYFCRFLTDVKIALPLRRESHRCSHLVCSQLFESETSSICKWYLAGVFLVPSPVCWQQLAIFVFPWAVQFFTWSFWPLNLLALLVISICDSGFVVSSSCVYCRAEPEDGG